ncbi:mitochondrial ribosomal protein L28-domain-containing protein [Lipomyces arxii]|uniref:mitochondrial 54S ribosomal protein mL40 n=1 Tax=Lipomyces arxii TaxID=56418 RepID=UPI0034CD9F24
MTVGLCSRLTRQLASIVSSGPAMSKTLRYDTKISSGSLFLTRSKRTKVVGENAQKTKLVNQLSLISPLRKQPRRLFMAFEDLLRHRTIHRAWQLHSRNKRTARRVELEQQYQKMKLACDELEKASPYLFKSALVKESPVRFPLEYKIPTDTPPRRIWDSAWKPPVEMKQKKRL